MDIEIIFIVEDDPEGGYTAHALGFAIVTQADDLAELRRNVREAVQVHFDPGEGPKIIRLHFVHDEVIAV